MLYVLPNRRKQSASKKWQYQLDYRFKGPQLIKFGSLQGVCQRMIGDPSYFGAVTVQRFSPFTFVYCGSDTLHVPAPSKGPPLHSFMG
jgi:hypothetical protein